MYDYRKMTAEERKDVLQQRREKGFPLHAPPRLQDVGGLFLISAACYEHRPIFANPDDLSLLMEETLSAFGTAVLPHPAWVFLPNHYHILTETEDMEMVSAVVRLLHSRVATIVNGRHQQRGRKVWYRFSDRLIRDERHYYATLNYIHYNPIKHGYVDRMSAWPWSSVHQYVETQGMTWLEGIWKKFPVKEYGKGWDW